MSFMAGGVTRGGGTMIYRPIGEFVLAEKEKTRAHTAPERATSLTGEKGGKNEVNFDAGAKGCSNLTSKKGGKEVSAHVGKWVQSLIKTFHSSRKRVGTFS